VALGIYSWVTRLVAPHIVSLRIEADRSKLEPNERTRVKLRALHFDGAEKELIEGIQWQSSDSSVATVSASGEVEGVKPGQTEITALYEGKKSNPLWLVVSSREPPFRSQEPPIREITNLVVGARKNTIIVGERIELTTVAKYSDGSEEKNSKEVRWESSDPAVAKVDDSGKLEGLRQGQVRITAQYRDRMTESMTFTVRPAVQLVSLAIHVEKTELKINERIAASVKGTYSDGKVASISKGVKWKSGDTTIAEVDPEGQLVAHRSGKVDIIASYGTVESSPLKLSVVPDAPKLLALRVGARNKVLKVGEASPLRVSGEYSDGKVRGIRTGVDWYSTDKGVAEVSPQGVVVGRRSGKATIFATYEGQKNPGFTFTVVEDKEPKVQPEPPEIAVLPGRYRVIRYTAVYRESRLDSVVIKKLDPGIVVNVVAASGEFLRIESKMGNPPAYVLRNDVQYAEEEKRPTSEQRGQEPEKRRVARPVVGARWANSRSEAAQLALADCSQRGDGCKIIRSVCATKTGSRQYGAIAYSSATGAHGYSFDYANRESAQARALSECGADCKIAVWFNNACAALAVGQTR
jgi:hypothetical protein